MVKRVNFVGEGPYGIHKKKCLNTEEQKIEKIPNTFLASSSEGSDEKTVRCLAMISEDILRNLNISPSSQKDLQARTVENIQLIAKNSKSIHSIKDYIRKVKTPSEGE
jgi:hypothetical protein